MSTKLSNLLGNNWVLPGGELVGTIQAQTLSNKNIVPRAFSTTSITNQYSWSSDNYDIYNVSFQSQDASLLTDSGSPQNGQKIIFNITCDETPRSITFIGGLPKSFFPKIKPFTIVGNNFVYELEANKTTYFGCIYNSSSERWDIVSISPNKSLYPTEGISVSSGNSWITSLAVPSGDIVGTEEAQTISNKLIVQRTNSTASFNSDLNWNSNTYDMYIATAQASNFSILNDSGSPFNGQKMFFRISTDENPRTVTFSGGVSKSFVSRVYGLTTVGNNYTFEIEANKVGYFGCIYNSYIERWEIVSLSPSKSPSEGIAVSSGNSWLTSLTVPSGDIVGTQESQTISNKKIEPRVSSTVSYSSPLNWNSSAYDVYTCSAQATNLTINPDTGVPSDGQKLIFRFTCDGTARTITFIGGSSKSFKRVGANVTVSGSNYTYSLPINKTTYFGCTYNTASDRWEIIGTSREA